MSRAAVARADRRPQNGERPTAPAQPRRSGPPLEHRMLLTATLCLLALGAVMVYSASSPLGVLGGHGGTGTGQFIRYLVFSGLGLAALQLFARTGTRLLHPRLIKLLLLGSFVLLLVVLVPGLGVQVNGARRWFALGPIQFQPSELMKLALVLYVVRYLADHPKRLRGFRQAIAPIAVVRSEERR